MSQIEDFAHTCGLWNDDYLLTQFHKGPGKDDQVEESAVIAAEVARRGLSPEASRPVSVAPSSPTAASVVCQLWRGERSLRETYWGWGVLCNMLLAMLIEVALQGAPGIALVLLLFGVVYWFFIAVATWRSAGRYGGPRAWSLLARAAVILGTFDFCAHSRRPCYKVRPNPRLHRPGLDGPFIGAPAHAAAGLTIAPPAGEAPAGDAPSVSRAMERA